MAFWNTRDDDAADAAADELESVAVGVPRGRVGAAEAAPAGFPIAPLGLIAAAVAVLLVLLLFTPVRAPWYGGWLPEREAWIPRGDAVYASQRLADIEVQQRLADARATGWEDVPAIDAHVGSFAAQTPPR